MQKYQSNKVIEAFLITNILNRRTVSPTLKGDNDQVIVDGAYMRKHNPLVGGYYVRYKSGYESWSPADEFEDGNTPIEDDEDGGQSTQEDQGVSGLDGGRDSPDEPDKRTGGKSGGSDRSSSS